MCAPDDGWRHHPIHVEQFPDINKLGNIASRLKYIQRNILTMHGPLNVKFKKIVKHVSVSRKSVTRTGEMKHCSVCMCVCMRA